MSEHHKKNKIDNEHLHEKDENKNIDPIDNNEKGDDSSDAKKDTNVGKGGDYTKKMEKLSSLSKEEMMKEIKFLNNTISLLEKKIKSMDGIISDNDLKYAASLSDLKTKNAADIDNMQKRYMKQIDDGKKYAVKEFIRDLVEVFENFNRADQHILKEENNVENEQIKSIRDGIAMNMKLMDSFFAKYSVSRIHPLNEKFDYNFHQALKNVETDEYEENTVIEVVSSGYLMKDQLIRPALVIVSIATHK